jgi:UDP-glucose 4-epimerase
MSLLVTWWLWFIGSHTVVELLEAGYDVVIVDNLSNSKRCVLDALEKITNKRPHFVAWDVTDKQCLEQIFSTYSIEWVLHFAAKKAVGESCLDPWLYYQENIVWLMTLTKTMYQFGCKKIVFSSSCTVYDPVKSKAPFDENAPLWNNFSPYGTTKYCSELILRDLCLHQWYHVANLRYFNPIGAHPTWLIGEDPSKPPTNVLPVIFQVIKWEKEYLSIFGDQYETPDGTCLRDYIHVVDIAKAHVSARNRLNKSDGWTREAINLWTGIPTWVKELVAITEKVTTQKLSVEIVAPRPWDVPVAFANPLKAKKLLWRTAHYSVEDAIRDWWQFIQWK